MEFEMNIKFISFQNMLSSVNEHREKFLNYDFLSSLKSEMSCSCIEEKMTATIRYYMILATAYVEFFITIAPRPNTIMYFMATYGKFPDALEFLSKYKLGTMEIVTADTISMHRTSAIKKAYGIYHQVLTLVTRLQSYKKEQREAFLIKKKVEEAAILQGCSTKHPSRRLFQISRCVKKENDTKKEHAKRRRKAREVLMNAHRKISEDSENDADDETGKTEPFVNSVNVDLTTLIGALNLKP